MSLATSFLALVRKANADLDLERVRADVHAFAARHEGLSTREIARLLVTRSARRAAVLGAAAGLPPGWASLATVGPELAVLIVLQSRLILGLHVLYGREPDPEERALEVLAGLAAGAGLRVGRKLTAHAAEEVAQRLLVRAGGRSAAHVVPIAGAMAGAAINYLAVRGVGRAAIARLEHLYGPPELPGQGRIVDVPGRIT